MASNSATQSDDVLTKVQVGLTVCVICFVLVPNLSGRVVVEKRVVLLDD